VPAHANTHLGIRTPAATPLLAPTTILPLPSGMVRRQPERFTVILNEVKDLSLEDSSLTLRMMGVRAKHRRVNGRCLRSDRHHTVSGSVRALFQIVAKLLTPAGMAELAQRLGFDLANPFARHTEFPADLFQRPAPAVVEPEAQLQHPALPLAE
jgi:hypothetical protein